MCFLFTRSGDERLTVDGLDPLDVVLVQCEVVGVNPAVQRDHNGAGVVGMLQTQGVTKLVDCNQEEIYTCRPHVQM